jgi:hypothetical protein
LITVWVMVITCKSWVCTKQTTAQTLEGHIKVARNEHTIAPIRVTFLVSPSLCAGNNFVPYNSDSSAERNNKQPSDLQKQMQPPCVSALMGLLLLPPSLHAD